MEGNLCRAYIFSKITSTSKVQQDEIHIAELSALHCEIFCCSFQYLKDRSAPQLTPMRYHFPRRVRYQRCLCAWGITNFDNVLDHPESPCLCVNLPISGTTEQNMSQPNAILCHMYLDLDRISHCNTVTNQEEQCGLGALIPGRQAAKAVFIQCRF